MQLFQRFRRDARGATIIEFALVAPVFFFLMFVVIELGLLLFTQVALESATMQVSRSAAICNKAGNGTDCASIVRTIVQQRTKGLVNAKGVVVEARSLAQGGVPRIPDICITDPPSSPPTCPEDIPYVDNNGNKNYDAPGGVSVGSAGDLVEIRATLPWELMIPFLDRMPLFGSPRTENKLYGTDGIVTLSASTVIKNEPQ